MLFSSQKHITGTTWKSGNILKHLQIICYGTHKYYTSFPRFHSSWCPYGRPGVRTVALVSVRSPWCPYGRPGVRTVALVSVRSPWCPYGRPGVLVSVRSSWCLYGHPGVCTVVLVSVRSSWCPYGHPGLRKVVQNEIIMLKKLDQTSIP